MQLMDLMRPSSSELHTLSMASSRWQEHAVAKMWCNDALAIPAYLPLHRPGNSKSDVRFCVARSSLSHRLPEWPEERSTTNPAGALAVDIAGRGGGEPTPSMPGHVRTQGAFGPPKRSDRRVNV